MKSYFKIGIAVSLAVHVGAFALGGYAMDKLIHKEKVQQQAEDITYVDVSTDQDSGDEPEAEAVYEHGNAEQSESDVSITGQEEAPAEAPQQEAKQAAAPDEGKADAAPKGKKHLRRLSDVKGLTIKEIPPQALNLNLADVKDSSDLMPHMKKRVLPEYDHSLIPEGEEVQVTIEFIVDRSGKVIQAYPVWPAQKSGVVPADVAEDLDAASLEALKQFEIEPPKNPQAGGSGQQVFILTREGARFGAAADLP